MARIAGVNIPTNKRVTIALRYIHGIGLLQHRTKAMAPSAPSRIATVVLVLNTLSNLDLHSATRATIALLSGHTVETLVVWWSIRRRLTVGSLN